LDYGILNVNTIKIQVAISRAGNPELFDALYALPGRSRAERMRLLATLGVVRNGGFVERRDDIKSEDAAPSSKAAIMANKLGGQF
jgi:predicted Zn-ribbon and HTH transcriptional regulator